METIKDEIWLCIFFLRIYFLIFSFYHVFGFLYFVCDVVNIKFFPLYLASEIEWIGRS
jgi:hypothetical protein